MVFERVRDLGVPKTTIARVADHFDHIRRVASIEVLGIGGDYDGNDEWPEGLEDVSKYPNLFAELIRRGWTDRELELIAGGNVLRAMERTEEVARQLQKTLPPPSFDCTPTNHLACGTWVPSAVASTSTTASITASGAVTWITCDLFTSHSCPISESLANERCLKPV